MTSTQQPEFANSFGTGVAADGSEMTRQRTSSRDYSNTAEWGEWLPILAVPYALPASFLPGLLRILSLSCTNQHISSLSGKYGNHNLADHNTRITDASKTPPSRFQKRKGSIYATPSSRDGHVERNRDAVEEFHRAHSKRWSISSASSAGDKPAAYGGGDHTAQQQQQQGRKSSVSGGQ